MQFVKGLTVLVCLASTLYLGPGAASAGADSPAPSAAAKSTTPPDGSTADPGTRVMNVNVRESTLGAGLELGGEIDPDVAGRLGINSFSQSRTLKGSQVDYDASVKIQNIDAIIDYRPAKNGSFHLSGGVYLNSDDINAVAKAGSTFTINGIMITASDAGTLKARVVMPSLMPYIGIGWGKPVSKPSGLHILFDMGAVFQDASVSLTATGALADPAFASYVTAEQATLQSDIDKLRVIPIVSLGLEFGF